MNPGGPELERIPLDSKRRKRRPQQPDGRIWVAWLLGGLALAGALNFALSQT